MKFITTVLLVVAIIFTMSCKKSSNDPVDEYTIKYKVTSIGDITMDTIMYLDVNGAIQFLTGETNFSHMFNQPSNNYGAKLYVDGEIGASGNCTYSIRILDKDSIEVKFEEGYSNTPNSHFVWLREFSKSSN